MQRRYKLQYVWAIGIALALPLVALAAYTYTAFDYVGVLYGTTPGTATITEAFGIDNSGKIVGGFCADGDTGPGWGGGCSAPGNAPSHGYVRFKQGTATIFKAINYPNNSFETEATGTNGRTIVGLYDPTIPVPANADLGKGFYCTFSSSTGCTDFHTVVYPGSTSTDLQAVNEYGDMVGLYSLIAVPPFTDFGFLLSKGKFCTIDIGKAPGHKDAVDTNALGISEENSVVGSYDDPLTGVTAFLMTDVEVEQYKKGKPQLCEFKKLTTFVYPGAGVHQTEAAGISEGGLIVGNYLDNTPNPDTSHAFQVQSNPDGTINTATYATIDFIPLQPGDNAAASINPKGTVVVGNFEDTR